MNKIFSEHIIHAVCDGLIYSLGLGIILAFTSGTIILFTRKASAKLRYNLLITALGLFTVAVFSSFIKQLLLSYPTHDIYTNTGTSISVMTTAPTPGNIVNHSNSITDFFRAHANTIVLLWLLIVVVKAFQLMTGLQSLRLLKKKELSSAGQQWEAQVRLLSNKLGIRRMVRIAASGIAKVPMVIGHLKPIILLPVGLLTSMSPENIEAILVHELAHIRRNDWLVNFFVSILEIIFFFNPAVLWVATLIRNERENCCDDIAIEITGSKVNYIHTLVACQEFQLSSNSYSLAFSGQKKPLLARVKRMISNKNSSLNRTEQGIIALTLFITLAGVILISCKKQNNLPASSVYTTLTDSTPVHTRSYQTITDKVTNGLPSSISRIDSIAFETTSDAPSKRDPVAEEILFDNEKLNEPENRQDGKNDFAIQSISAIKSPRQATMPTTDLVSRLVVLDSMLYQVNKQRGKISMQINGNKVAPAQQSYYLDKLSRLTTNTTSYTTAPYVSTYDDYERKCQSYDDETNLNKLIAALIAANVIHSKEELLSFMLSDTEFIMNGIKMPDAIYLPLKKAFVQVPAAGKKGSWAWMYNYERS